MQVELFEELAQFGLEVRPDHVVGDESAKTDLHRAELTQEHF